MQGILEQYVLYPGALYILWSLTSIFLVQCSTIVVSHPISQRSKSQAVAGIIACNGRCRVNRRRETRLLFT